MPRWDRMIPAGFLFAGKPTELVESSDARVAQ